MATPDKKPITIDESKPKVISYSKKTTAELMEEFNCNWSDEDKSLIQINVNANRKHLLSQHSIIELSVEQAEQLFEKLSTILKEVKK